MPLIGHYAGIPGFPTGGRNIQYTDLGAGIGFSLGNKHFEILKEEIYGVQQKTEREISKDVTLTRLLVFGVFAFGMKKKTESTSTYTILSIKKDGVDMVIMLGDSRKAYQFFFEAASDGQKTRALKESRSRQEQKKINADLKPNIQEQHIEVLKPLRERGHNYVQVGVPLRISKSYILNNQKNGSIHLKFDLQNVSESVIYAVKVAVYCYDDFGVILNEKKPLILTIQDLNIRPGIIETLGPVELNHTDTRAVVLRINQVKYATEIIDYEHFAMVDRPDALTGSLLNSSTFLYGNKARYLPQETDYGWICSCGWVNSHSQSSCCQCHISRKNALERTEESIVRDANEKKNQADEQIRITHQNQAAAEQRQQDNFAQKKRNKRNVFVLVTILSLGLLFFYVIQPLITRGDSDTAGIENLAQTNIHVTASVAAVKTTPSKTSALTVPAKLYGTVMSGGGANVRDAAGMNGNVIGVAQAGTTLVLIQPNYEDGDWHEVEFDGHDAFIHKDRLVIEDSTINAFTSRSSAQMEVTSSTKVSQPGDSASNPVIVSASQLVMEVDANPTAASTKYSRKYLQVSGTVVFNSSYSDMNGYYLVNTRHSGRTRVVCWFSPPNQDYSVGDFITVVGYCRSVEESTELSKCVGK